MKTFYLIIKRCVLISLCALVTACGTIGGGAGGGMGLGLTGDQSGAVDGGSDELGPTDSAGVFEGPANDDSWNQGGLGTFESVGPAGQEAGHGGGGQGGAEDFGATKHSAAGEPIGIPVTIAKAEKPKPDKIVVTLEEIVESEEGVPEEDAGDEGPQGPEPKKMVVYKMMMKGLAGAVPSPEANPYVYVYNPVSGEEVFAKVYPDGSFEPVSLEYKVKSSLVVAVSNQEVIGEPIVFRSNNPNTYSWRRPEGGKPIAVATYERDNPALPQFYMDFSDEDETGVKLADQDGVHNKKPAGGDREPRISLRDQDADDSVTEARTVNNDEVIFRAGQEIYEKNSDDEIRKIPAVKKGERVNRWEVMRKKPAPVRVGEQLPPKREGAKEDLFVAVLTDDALRVIHKDSSKIILESSLDGLTPAIVKMLDSNEPLEKVVTAIARSSTDGGTARGK